MSESDVWFELVDPATISRTFFIFITGDRSERNQLRDTVLTCIRVILLAAAV